MSVFLKASSIAILAVGAQLAFSGTALASAGSVSTSQSSISWVLTTSEVIHSDQAKPGSGLKGDEYEPPVTEPPRTSQPSGTR